MMRKIINGKMLICEMQRSQKKGERVKKEKKGCFTVVVLFLTYYALS